MYEIIFLFCFIIPAFKSAVAVNESEVVNYNTNFDKPLNEDEGIQYLYKFGYLKKNITTEAGSLNEPGWYKSGLVTFQDLYQLPPDGTFNNETVQLIRTPRCGVKDDNFYQYQHKWYKNNLSWNIITTNFEIEHTAEKAFNTWQNVSNLIFKRDPVNPDILITLKNAKHNNSIGCQKGVCSYDFEENTAILAHASFPEGNVCREIHINLAKNWYYGVKETIPQSTISFYSVLIHEIGHTLGLPHSSDADNIMYAYYDGVRNLSKGDIDSIQMVYGVPREEKKDETINDEKQVKVISEEKPANTTSDMEPDLCAIMPTNFLITSSRKMYIFYKSWVWDLNLNNRTYIKPIKFENYLSFPSFDHIYQRPAGNILFVRGPKFYVIQPTTFQPLYSYYGKRIESLIGLNITPNPVVVNGMVNGYLGLTYIFYNSFYYASFYDYSIGPQGKESVSQYGRIQDKFPGIPPEIDFVVRYTNGNLYFFKDKMFYEFNEITGEILRAQQFNLDIFGVKCSARKIDKITAKISEILRMEL